MSQQVIDFLDNNPREIPLGGIDERETWWVERQEALERAGYMLLPRYRPSWKPSWAGTNKLYFRFEDGQKKGVSVDFFSLTGSSAYNFSYVWAWTQPGSLTEDPWC